MRSALACLALCCALAMAAPSTVTLTSSANPAVLGQSLTLTAAVTPSTATGKVTFYNGVTIVGIATLSGGQAGFTTTLLPSAATNLHAYYSGDANYAASTSASITETISALAANGFQQVQTTCLCNAAVEGDFNGDGKPDLLVNYGWGFTVLLGNGDGTFQTGNTYSAGIVIALGDFNGDGATDAILQGPLLGGSSQVAPVFLALGNGDGTFRPPTTLGYIGFGAAVVGDFNGDGKADLVLSAGGIYSVLLGNGDGTFRQLPDSGQLGISSLVAGDFNGDGKPDLAFSTYGEIGILLGNGDGTFAAPIYTAAVQPGSLAVRDFNGDGKLDLVTIQPPLAPAYAAGSYTVLLGNGDGTFHVLPSVAGYFGSISIGDFNGDGKPDLLFGAPLETGVLYGAISLWLGNGDGTFHLSASFEQYASNPIVGDFNDDGRTDFLLPVATTEVTAYLGVPQAELTISASHSGSFTSGSTDNLLFTVSNGGTVASAGTATVTAALSEGLTATAINGNGWSCTLSTLTCTRADSLPPAGSYPQVDVTVNVATNIFFVSDSATVSVDGLAPEASGETIVITLVGTTVLTSSPNPSVFGQPVTLTATQTPTASYGWITFYDGATVLGVSSISSGQTSFTTRLLASGTHMLFARFEPTYAGAYPTSTSATIPQTVNPAAANGFQPAVTYLSGTTVTSVVMADFNGDGKTDIAAAGNGTVSVLLGNGDGTFRAPLTTTASFGIFLSRLAVGDFNGDGKPDLVVAAEPANGYTAIAVLLGNGDGTFQSPKLYGSLPLAPGILPVPIVVADFNGDGKADIAFSAYQGSAISVWLGAGDGTFPTQSTISASAFGTLVTSDFNGDGKADLAYGDAIGNLNVLLGNGDGTFQSSFIYLAGGVSSLVVADFNGDGRPDLAFSSISTPFEIYVLFGNGNGTFQAPKSPNTASAVILAAADLNGDGKADLVLGEAGDTIYELTGNGDGTFQAPVPLFVGSTAWGVAVGDLNGDGRADLAVADSDGLIVFLGAEFANAPRANLAVWRPSNGIWYINQAQAAPITLQWGLPGDTPAAANYNGDGLTEYVVWRPSNGYWYFSTTADGMNGPLQWGLNGDIPVPGIYPGPAEFTVWRPSNGTWYTYPTYSKQWGLPGDVPIVADFDGDGITDFAVWRPSNGTWYITLSSSGAQVTKPWGLSGDIPVAADFDGDGKADYAVWRPSNGTWYVILSSTGQAVTTQWGLNGDIPVPHDYDLDGKADYAVWRPSNGTWYIVPSATPSVPLIVQWGIPGDIPIYKPPGN